MDASMIVVLLAGITFDSPYVKSKKWVKSLITYGVIVIILSMWSYFFLCFLREVRASFRKKKIATHLRWTVLKSKRLHAMAADGNAGKKSAGHILRRREQHRRVHTLEKKLQAAVSSSSGGESGANAMQKLRNLQKLKQAFTVVTPSGKIGMGTKKKKKKKKKKKTRPVKKDRESFDLDGGDRESFDLDGDWDSGLADDAFDDKLKDLTIDDLDCILDDPNIHLLDLDSLFGDEKNEEEEWPSRFTPTELHPNIAARHEQRQRRIERAPTESLTHL